MASKDTGGQKRASKTSEEVDEVQADASSDVTERKDKLDQDIDAMLDEIDDVLRRTARILFARSCKRGGSEAPFRDRAIP